VAQMRSFGWLVLGWLGQATLARAQEAKPPPPPEISSASIDLGFHHSGISLGNAPDWNGLRFNFADAGVHRVNGFNFTLWVPEHSDNSNAIYNGLSLGIAPVGGWYRGVTVGVGADVAEHALTGLNAAGLAVVSEGAMRGINAAGLALVAEGWMWGFNFGGLAVVGERGIAGMTLGGLAVVSEGRVSGLSLSLLATVAGKEGLQGLGSSGLAVVAEGPIRGFALSSVVVGGGMDGLAVGALVLVSERDMNGAFAGGLTLVGDGTLRGFAFSPLHVRIRDVRGVVVAPWIRSDSSVTGVAFGLFNDVRGVQRGLSVGVYNSADVLEGVQIGLLNRAKNNPPGTRWLPIVNAHFG
jgi:hypothetical protein